MFPDVTNRPLSELTSLRGRGVIITGAARGLGYAIAQRVIDAEGAVLIVDHDRARVSRATVDLENRRERAQVHSFVADVTDSAAVDHMIDHAGTVLPSISGLVNNVGVFPSSLSVDMNDELWRHVVDTNLTSAFYCSRAFARAVEPARGGSVVMNGSIESVRGLRRQAHYTATKFGMIGLAQSLALELGDRNIRVNTIGPGLIDTESTAASPLVSDPAQRAQWDAAIPAGRMGVPDDVARAALFYLCDLSMFVTGTVLLVDGGQRAQ